jgi:hypothetical protein
VESIPIIGLKSLRLARDGSAREMLAKEYDHDAFCKSLKESLITRGRLEARSQKKMTTGTMTTHPIATKQGARECPGLCREGFNNEWEAYQAVYDADWPAAGALGMSAKD